MGIKAVSKLIYFISITIYLFFVIITLLGAFFSSSDPNKHSILSYIGVILPGLIIINLLYIIYWGIRRKWWLFFSFIAILCNYEFLGSMFHYSKDINYTGETIKIATYNIHAFDRQSTGYNAKQIAKFMKKEQVDVICFQEFVINRHFNLDSISNAFGEYPYKYIPLSSQKETRIAVFSKFPITDSLFIPFPGSNNCGMYSDIQIRNKTIRLFNVHMQTTNLNTGRNILTKEIRADNATGEKKALENINKQIVNNKKIRGEQAKLIRNYAERTVIPVVICGDFNDTPATYTYKEMKGNLKDGFKTCGKGYAYTFRGLFKLLRIDYIFHSPTLQGIQYYSPSLKWSDHNPVIMELGV